MNTPRPHLITNGSLSGSAARTKAREQFVATLLARSATEESRIRTILATHRRRQTRKLGARDEDPDPYDQSYIFFCLDGRRET